MTKFSNKFKKAYFWFIFWDKYFPQKNPALLHKTPHGLLAPCQGSEKTNEPFPRKRLDGKTEGRRDGRMAGWADPNL